MHAHKPHTKEQYLQPSIVSNAVLTLYLKEQCNRNKFYIYQSTLIKIWLKILIKEPSCTRQCI